MHIGKIFLWQPYRATNITAAYLAAAAGEHRENIY